MILILSHQFSSSRWYCLGFPLRSNQIGTVRKRTFSISLQLINNTFRQFRRKKYLLLDTNMDNQEFSELRCDHQFNNIIRILYTVIYRHMDFVRAICICSAVNGICLTVYRYEMYTAGNSSIFLESSHSPKWSKLVSLLRYRWLTSIVCGNFLYYKLLVNSEFRNLKFSSKTETKK